MNHRHIPKPRFDRIQIVRLIQSGVNNKKIASDLGCSVALVKYVKRKNGLSKPKGMPKLRDYQERFLNQIRKRSAWELAR